MGYVVSASLTDPKLFNRRKLLRAGACLSALALAGGRANAASGTKVTQFIWTGAQEPVPRRLAAEYVKAHPDVQIEIISGTNAATYPKIKASLDINPDEPLVNFGFFNLDATAKGRTSNVWLPLDKTVVPNVENILDAYRQPDDMGAFFCMDVCGLVYNTDKIKTAPTSWMDLFDPKYKGRVTFFDYYWAGNGLVAVARLNGGGEDNIEPGMRIYADAAKAGHIHSLYTSNAQLQQLLVSGEVWIAPYFRGVALPWAAQGAPIGYAVPKEGQVTFPEGFQLVRGSNAAQRKVSQDIIGRSLEPDAVLDYCRTAAVLPLMKNIKLPDDLARDPSIQPAALNQAMNLDYLKMAANTPAWTDQWNKQVKANLK
jgi:putative spermidine/putrescine transport system substrate-binding protein